MSAPAVKRKAYLTSLTVDVDIDASVLEYNGYHHEDDYTAEQPADTADDRQALLDWHDLNHGLTLWANCTHEPCSVLSDEFRSSR